MRGLFDLKCNLRQVTQHRIHIAVDDRARRGIDVLHRFIAHLNLPNFQIKKVDVLEEPIGAYVTFAETQPELIANTSIISLFKRRRDKANKQIKLNLSLNKLDQHGLNFFIYYDFEIGSGRGADHMSEPLNTDIHAMIRKAFDGSPSFSISRMSIEA